MRHSILRLQPDLVLWLAVLTLIAGTVRLSAFGPNGQITRR